VSVCPRCIRKTARATNTEFGRDILQLGQVLQHVLIVRSKRHRMKLGLGCLRGADLNVDTTAHLSTFVTTQLLMPSVL